MSPIPTTAFWLKVGLTSEFCFVHKKPFLIFKINFQRQPITLNSITFAPLVQKLQKPHLLLLVFIEGFLAVLKKFGRGPQGLGQVKAWSHNDHANKQTNKQTHTHLS
jgi:hypothetical protein